jgi:hypothetical protein
LPSPFSLVYTYHFASSLQLVIISSDFSDNLPLFATRLEELCTT